MSELMRGTDPNGVERTIRLTNDGRVLFATDTDDGDPGSTKRRRFTQVYGERLDPVTGENGIMLVQTRDELVDEVGTVIALEEVVDYEYTSEDD